VHHLNTMFLTTVAHPMRHSVSALLARFGPLALLLFACVLSARAEKIWMTNASGFWREGTNWSGRTPPDITSFIRITNDITKTVTIDAITPSTNLTVQKLSISAPPGVTNTLLLSSIGVTNPLVFQTGLEMLDGAAIRVTNSGLQTLLTNDHVNIDGALTLDSGFIDFGDITVTARVGRVTSGTFTINGGVVYAGAVTVGGLTNSSGALNLNGGTLDVFSFLSAGRDLGTTGTVTVLGGYLNVTNDDTRVGDEGVGHMLLSNCTAIFNNLQVGRNNSGSLILQAGATSQVVQDTVVGRFTGVTGTVSVAGGQLLAGGQAIYVGRGGSGSFDIESGLVQADTLLVAADRTNSIGASGILSITNGRLTLSSSLLVGSASYSTGQVFITGGAVAVTNSAGSGAVNVSSGGLSLSGGSITADLLLVTNQAGQFTFSAGILSTKGTTVANGAPFVVGNGTAPATLHLNGGIHSFADGLVISHNASLTGCGIVIGSVINNGTISTNCSGTLIAPVIITPPQSQTAVLGGKVTFSVVATGTQPLAYQWKAHGTNLPGATATALTRTNLQLADAGTYLVVVTNLAGFTNSPTITLQVLAGVVFSLQNRASSTNTFSFSSNPGSTYTLQYKNALSDTAWTDLLPSTNGTGNPILLRDTNAAGPRRFYRIRSQ
jgi:hypothetical protein